MSLFGSDADELGLQLVWSLERDEEGVAALHDVVVGDDVPLAVPDKARTAALRDREIVHVDVLAHRDVGDEDHRGRGRLEDRDGVLLLGRAPRPAARPPRPGWRTGSRIVSWAIL